MPALATKPRPGMEHRLYRRYPARVLLKLFVQDRLLAVVPSQEISSAGVCLTNTGLDLHPYQEVVVDFIGLNTPLNTRALVIHRSAEKIGLMFASLMPLNKILQHSS